MDVGQINQQEEVMNRQKLIWQGKRVELHPGCDRWMRGDRFGTVVDVITSKRKAAATRLCIKMDKSGATIRTTENMVTVV